MNCLARVKAAYGHNPDTMRKFYMFAQREELLMDEVELPPEQLVQRQALFKQVRRLAGQLHGLRDGRRLFAAVNPIHSSILQRCVWRGCAAPI